MKDDALMLLNIFRLYQLHHVTSQLVILGTIARKYKVKNVALPDSFLGRDDAGDDSEHSDYCDDDFKDLMSL